MNVDYKQNLLLLYQLRSCNAQIQKAKTLGDICMLFMCPKYQIMVPNMLTLFMHTYCSPNYSGIIFPPPSSDTGPLP